LQEPYDLKNIKALNFNKNKHLIKICLSFALSFAQAKVEANSGIGIVINI
jgi:hypothetical protein